MTINQQENFKKFHFIYSIILSISIVIAGLLLIISCINIYRTGDNPFSREAVSDSFTAIAIPVYLAIILTVIGFVLDIIHTKNVKKTKPVKSYEFILNIMYKKRELSDDNSKLAADINQLRSRRRLFSIVRSLVVLVCSVVFLIYSLNSKHFHQTNINDSIIKAMLVLAPCLIISFVMTLITMYHNEKSIQAEIELLKQAPIKKSSDNTNSDKIPGQKPVLITRYIILALGLVFLIYGFVSGGTVDVLTKAINICTECIGLG